MTYDGMFHAVLNLQIPIYMVFIVLCVIAAELGAIVAAITKRKG